MCDHIFVRISYSVEALNGKISNCLKCNYDYYRLLFQHINANIDEGNKLFDEHNGDVPQDYYERPMGHTCVWDLKTLTCCQAIKYPEDDGKNYGYKIENGYIRTLIPERTKCHNKPSESVIQEIKSCFCV